MILTAIWHILTDLKPYTPEGFLDSRPVNKEKVLTTSQALNPVSYTHLDVYKRQAIQLLLLFPVFSVRLRTVLFLLRIRSDIFSGYYMRLRHLRYRFCFHLCTTLSLSVWTALHIFSPLSVTADCTGWYNFLPTTIYLWLISLTSSKELSILLLKLLECR